MATKKSASIYGLIDPRTQAVRYIGKAVNVERRLAQHLREARRLNRPVHCWIRKLASLGTAPTVRVLEAAPADWREAERRLIAEHRAVGPLLNVADGGDEPFCPIEVRAENARRLNAQRVDPIVHGNRNVIRMLGQVVHQMRRLGKPERATSLNGKLDVVKQLNREKPEVLFAIFATSRHFQRHLGLPVELLEEVYGQQA